MIGLAVDRGAKLELSVPALVALAASRLGHHVADLGELSADELGRHHEIVHSLKRPALE
ncbi:MAG: hypothetical protein ACREQ4_06200 [Candidatus Binataceae bacterium]